MRSAQGLRIREEVSEEEEAVDELWWWPSGCGWLIGGNGDCCFEIDLVMAVVLLDWY